MRAVVIDSCVLANFALCDTLLRLAEGPRLFEPKWSDEILRETVRTLKTKLGWPGYEPLSHRMENDPNHRHV